MEDLFLLSVWWFKVYNAGPALKQHWLNALCLLGCDSTVHVFNNDDFFGKNN